MHGSKCTPPRYDRIRRSAGQGGFATVPASALDPPHCAASPAVPALIGSGSPLRCLLQFAEFLEFSEDLWMALGQVADHTCILEET